MPTTPLQKIKFKQWMLMSNEDKEILYSLFVSSYTDLKKDNSIELSKKLCSNEIGMTISVVEILVRKLDLSRSQEKSRMGEHLNYYAYRKLTQPEIDIMDTKIIDRLKVFHRIIRSRAHVIDRVCEDLNVSRAIVKKLYPYTEQPKPEKLVRSSVLTEKATSFFLPISELHTDQIVL
jgi:hypothetical protein